MKAPFDTQKLDSLMEEQDIDALAAGIKARGGCFCAGPYLQRRYVINDTWSAGMH